MKVMCKGSGMLLRTTLVWSNLHWKQNILLTRPNVCQFFFMETVCPLLASARAGARLQPYFHGAACWQLHRQKSRCDLFGEHSISCANLTVMMDLLVHLLHFSKSFAGRCNVCILVSGPIGITWGSCFLQLPGGQSWLVEIWQGALLDTYSLRSETWITLHPYYSFRTIAGQRALVQFAGVLWGGSIPGQTSGKRRLG